MSVRGALLTEAAGGIQIVDDLQVEAPRRGEALVELDAAGVCGSDLAVRDGKVGYPMPVVLGHEATGTVTAVGEGADEAGVREGQRVALWMRPPCRACRSCVRGEAHLCERSGVMSARGTLPDGRTALTRGDDPVHRAFGIGAFASSVVMPVGGLVPVPDDVPVEVAALSSCGVATGAGAVLNVARPEPGDVVCVFGGGGVGMAAVMAAVATGAGAVVLVDPAENRREQALALGATVACPSADRSALRAALADAIGGDAVIDVVIDCVGSPDLVAVGYRLVRQGGTVVAVGLQPQDATVTLPGPLVPLSHKQVLGCFMGGIDPHRDLPRLFALWRTGRFPVDRLVADRVGLDAVATALDDLAAARGLRTIVEVQR